MYKKIMVRTHTKSNLPKVPSLIGQLTLTILLTS